jgi:TrmH family RNA methyltransferase
VAEGPKLVSEALDAGASVETLFVDMSHAGPRHIALAERAAAHGARVIDVESGVLARVSDAVTPQPVTGIVAMLHRPIEAIDADGLIIVCAGLNDPGNAGTIVRSAAAAGARAVVFCAGGVDAYNPKAVRASAGGLFRIPLVIGPELQAAVETLAARGLTCLATVASGGRDHDRVDWTVPTALLIGSESQGLPDRVSTVVGGTVTIPMEPCSESLNAAMAATVVCFEAARQRRQPARGAA